MPRPHKKVYMAAGYNTVALGTGRKEFHPKKPRPGIEYYMAEAGKGVIDQIGGAQNIDESVIGNFMAARFNKQANLGGFMPMVDEKLRWKPAISVEGACGSGGLALVSGIRSVLSQTSEVVLGMGVEVQNTVKAIYGADILAGAGWYKKRKDGHAYFFPGQFSNRAGAYFQQFDREKTRKALARWYKQAIENARLCPTAQEYHNANPNLEETAIVEPNPRAFTDHLNVFDCSKVSDGASGIAICSEEGLQRIGINKKDAVEVVSFAQLERNITEEPTDPTQLEAMKKAIELALNDAGITIDQVGTVELHDCFSIAGLLAVEAMGLAPHGQGADYILAGNTDRDGEIPMNTTGGLIGWGHPTGATGVHQAVTIWEQLTERAGEAQIKLNPNRPYGLTINMGGDDVTLVAIVYKRGQ